MGNKKIPLAHPEILRFSKYLILLDLSLNKFITTIFIRVRLLARFFRCKEPYTNEEIIKGQVY
ncbi:hypothetical protein THIOM_002763 [Candidatus Thiomargarita nelsonii]|uniref:Uncharacterized protein n=1 Tax=Candidatus Thiomargarita nelsonii TaxID=1003181 RepID=A0A176S0J4_9GAMM|nr:hypothetical protein THIOM_002763 [Candidatus Thiomargarita nelsonii]